MKAFIVIDPQNDFITGEFHVPGAEEVVNSLVIAIPKFRDNGYKIITTRDEHVYGEDKTRKETNAPHHCEKGSYGAMFDPRIKDVIDHDEDIGIEKNTYGSFELINKLCELEAENGGIDEICICGFKTDISVINNALMLRSAFPKTEIFVVKNFTAGTSEEMETEALLIMSLNDINIISII